MYHCSVQIRNRENNAELTINSNNKEVKPTVPLVAIIVPVAIVMAAIVLILLVAVVKYKRQPPANPGEQERLIPQPRPHYHH